MDFEQESQQIEWQIHRICGYDVDRQIKLVKALKALKELYGETANIYLEILTDKKDR